MTDKALFLHINGLADKIPIIDGFFKGVSNDYFALVTSCLILVWLWFGMKGIERQICQKAVLTAAISIGLTSALVLISNHLYFRVRPFNELPPGSVNLLFYRPTDSSFPSNLASVLFAIVWPVFIKNKRYGSVLLGVALLAGFGRIYIGVHYPLDIVGGAAFGAVGALLAFGAIWLISPIERFLVKLLRIISLA
ncbi:MAG: phosphatase PAP2 family protein [Dehalococcoidales bacterium]